MATKLNIKEFEIDKVPLSCTWIVIGPPLSGKGVFCENMMFYNKHRIPVGRFITGSETQYARFKKIAHPLYVTNYYKENDEKKYIFRQRQCVLEKDKIPMGNSINIADDIGDDPKVFRSKLFLGLFKIGTQHWNHIFVLANQYAIDIPLSVRRSVSYVALFRNPDAIEREKLYKNFGGICGSPETFNKLMDALTGDYTCMIIHKNSQSQNLEDCIFWYRTKPMPAEWKFGSKEYHKWANDRYNKSYKEVVVM
jgi:hypothetical protein